MDEIQQRLIKYFQIVFDDLPEREVPRASKQNAAVWDSVASVSLLHVVEDEFQIRIGLDRLDKLDSFKRLYDYVSKAVKA
jgi:acyl carrier protein